MNELIQAKFTQTFDIPCRLIPLELSDDDTPIWIPLQNPQHLRATDDGCEHYRHIENGKHYVYDYYFKKEWREYQPVTQKTQDNMSLFNALIQLFKW